MVIYKNIFPEHRGTTLSPFASVNALTERQIGRVVLKVSGVAGTPAATLYTAINNHVLVYPYARQYNMVFGPNCNTFTQWLLELVPATRLSLPWYAWGKNYRHP